MSTRRSRSQDAATPIHPDMHYPATTGETPIDRKTGERA